MNGDGSRDHRRGESIYIGSARSNWETYTGGQPDGSNRNRIIGNRIWDAPAELIDIKEGTSFGLVEGNVFDGSQLIGGRNDEGGSWVDCKGTDYTFRNNTGSSTSGVAFEVQDVFKGSGLSGLRNVFESNRYVGSGPDYFIWIAASAEGGTTPTSPYHHNAVACDNDAGGSALGLSNIPCGP